MYNISNQPFSQETYPLLKLPQLSLGVPSVPKEIPTRARNPGTRESVKIPQTNNVPSTSQQNILPRNESVKTATSKIRYLSTGLLCWLISFIKLERLDSLLGGE